MSYAHFTYLLSRKQTITDELYLSWHNSFVKMIKYVLILKDSGPTLIEGTRKTY